MIELLPDNVINQIAAGEVIERPMSAVKELVENSLDAASSEIKISTLSGGKSLIQISDNGCGMSENDMEKCILRHATSKLREFSDIFRLSTNGFRGEALSSIASVSKLTIESCLREQKSFCSTGNRLEFENGILKNKEEIAMPYGTTITVKDLFFNTPVRAEFLKSNSVESSRILDCITRIAIANENVHFEYKSDKSLLFSSAKGNLEGRITDCLGSSIMNSLQEFNWEEQDIKIKGFVSKPESLKESKRRVPYIYLQRRPIFNSIIARAINQAYSPYTSYQPIAIIFLEMSPETFDVNVHPAKKEVRFSKDNAVFLAVNHAIHHALQSTISYPSFSVSDTFYEQAPAYFAENKTAQNREQYISVLENSENSQSYENIENKPFTNELFPDERITEFENTNITPPDLSPQDYIQIGKSYIICEHGSSMLIIDQHRAHKLILYERALKTLQNKENLDSQELLFPETVDIPVHLLPILEAQKSELKHLGFYMEPFGVSMWRLKGIPQHLSIKTAAKTIRIYLENISESKEIDIFKKNAMSFANSSAISYGTELSVQEMQNLISDLLSLPNPYETPKGEAIFMKMPLEDIKRKFQ